MGSGSELYKNHVEGIKRRIENQKKDIANYRDILKKNPGFPASTKATYQNLIAQSQKEVKMLQGVLASAKKTLATAIENEKEAKKREQEKIKKEKEKAKEAKKREQEEAKKAAAASRATSLSRDSSTPSSVKSSAVSASVAASLSRSSSSYSKPSTSTHTEPSTSRAETMSSYRTKSDEAPSSKNKSKGHNKKSLIFCILPALVGIYLLYSWYDSYIQWWDTIWQILCYVFVFPLIVYLSFFPLIIWFIKNNEGKD